MIAIAQAVADLIANPRPVLFLDTCALLDVVRAPLRNLTPTVRAGLQLRALAGAGTVQLFVQDIVPHEWTDNLPSARKDGEIGMLAFTATWELAHEFAQPAPPLPALPAGKDCHILCHALRLSNQLTAAGYPRWRLLVSSNREDFAAPNATVFHQDIVTDANAAGLRYAVSMEAAVADLKAAGEIP